MSTPLANPVGFPDWTVRALSYRETLALDTQTFTPSWNGVSVSTSETTLWTSTPYSIKRKQAQVFIAFSDNNTTANPTLTYRLYVNSQLLATVSGGSGNNFPVVFLAGTYSGNVGDSLTIKTTCQASSGTYTSTVQNNPVAGIMTAFSITQYAQTSSSFTTLTKNNMVNIPFSTIGGNEIYILSYTTSGSGTVGNPLLVYASDNTSSLISITTATSATTNLQTNQPKIPAKTQTIYLASNWYGISGTAVDPLIYLSYVQIEEYGVIIFPTPV